MIKGKLENTTTTGKLDGHMRHENTLVTVNVVARRDVCVGDSWLHARQGVVDDRDDQAAE